MANATPTVADPITLADVRRLLRNLDCGIIDADEFEEVAGMTEQEARDTTAAD